MTGPSRRVWNPDTWVQVRLHMHTMKSLIVSSSQTVSSEKCGSGRYIRIVLWEDLHVWPCCMSLPPPLFGCFKYGGGRPWGDLGVVTCCSVCYWDQDLWLEKNTLDHLITLFRSFWSLGLLWFKGQISNHVFLVDFVIQRSPWSLDQL